jgi:hypothetical protein
MKQTLCEAIRGLNLNPIANGSISRFITCPQIGTGFWPDWGLVLLSLHVTHGARTQKAFA